MQQAAIMYYNQVLIEGPTHPLFPDFTNTPTIFNTITTKNNTPKNTRWSSNIKQLIAQYNPGTTSAVTPLDLPPRTNPLQNINFHTDLIDKPKNSLTLEEKNNLKTHIENNIINPNVDKKLNLDIFTDGSVEQQNKTAGAAAIFILKPIDDTSRPHIDTFLHSIKNIPDYFCEDNSTNETLDHLYQDFQYKCPPRSGSMVTELIAIKKALETAYDTPYSDSKQNTFIYTDSLSAIYAIQNFPPKITIN